MFFYRGARNINHAIVRITYAINSRLNSKSAYIRNFDVFRAGMNFLIFGCEL